MTTQALSIHAGYFDLLQYAGLTVLDSRRFGKNKGDLVYVVTREGRYGIVIVGFGSCTGCDVLRSLQPPPGVTSWDPENLAQIELFAWETAANTRWGSRAELNEWLFTGSLLQWHGKEDHFVDVVQELLELIPA